MTGEGRGAGGEGSEGAGGGGGGDGDLTGRGGEGVAGGGDGGDLTGRGGEGGGRGGEGDQEDAPSATPGLDLMAGLSGRPREELTRDPRALAAGVRALGDGLVAILAGLSSADPAVRAAAEARRVEVLGSVRAAPPAGPRLRATVNEVLDEALIRLREDPPPPAPPPPPSPGR